jgi:hypothetical protein
MILRIWILKIRKFSFLKSPRQKICSTDLKTIDMEIREIVSYSINHPSKTLDVSFRTNHDKWDEYRSDTIFFIDIEDLGFEEILDAPQIDIEDEYYEEEYDIDENILMEFLEEYYLTYPNKLPKAEL